MKKIIEQRTQGQKVQVSKVRAKSEREFYAEVTGRIEAQITKSGMSIPDFAKKLTVTVPCARQYLNPERAMTLRSLHRIATALSVPVKTLLA